MGMGINSTLTWEGMEWELIPGKGRNGPMSDPHWCRISIFVPRYVSFQKCPIFQMFNCLKMPKDVQTRTKIPIW